MNGLTALIISVSGVLFVLHIKFLYKIWKMTDNVKKLTQCVFWAHSQNFENSSQLPSESANLKVVLNIIFIIMRL